MVKSPQGNNLTFLLNNSYQAEEWKSVIGPQNKRQVQMWSHRENVLTERLKHILVYQDGSSRVK